MAGGSGGSGATAESVAGASNTISLDAGEQKIIRSITVSFIASDPAYIANPILARVCVMRGRVDGTYRYDPVQTQRQLIDAGVTDGRSLDSQNLIWDVLLNTQGTHHFTFVDDELNTRNQGILTVIQTAVYDYSGAIVPGTYMAGFMKLSVLSTVVRHDNADTVWR